MTIESSRASYDSLPFAFCKTFLNRRKDLGSVPSEDLLGAINLVREQSGCSVSHTAAPAFIKALTGHHGAQCEPPPKVWIAFAL